MRRTKAETATDRQIDSLFYKHAQNVQISVMDLGKISAAGRTAIAAGLDPEPAIVAAIAQYRRN